MIVPGADAAAVQAADAVNEQAFRFFFYICPKGVELRCNGVEPVAFLQAHTAGTDDAGHAVATGSEHCQNRNQIGTIFYIEYTAFQVRRAGR